MRDNFKKYLSGALLAGVVLAPSVTWAQDTKGADETTKSSTESNDSATVEKDADAKKDANKKPWSVSATVLTRAYQGMFTGLADQNPKYSSPNAADPSASFKRWLNLYVVDLGYSVGDFSFGAEGVVSQWLTTAGGYNGPHEVRLEDTALTASWSGYNIEAIDTRISAGYELDLPTSTVSRAAGLIAANSLGVSVSHTFFDKLSLSYTLGGSWLPNVSPDAELPANVVNIYRPEEKVGSDVRVGGLNTEFGLSNGLKARIPVWDKLSASVSYSITKYWTYADQNNDQYTSTYAKVGRGTSDVTSASLALSYPINDYLSVAGGIRNRQLPKTADNSSLKFPWWDFTGAADNASAIQFSVTGSY